MPWNLPTLLTWTRVLAIPLLVAVFFLPVPPFTQNLLATVLFVAAAITDWLDGWLELTISALREWMAQMGARASVAVHSIGKFKTGAQLVAIPMLLYDARLDGLFHTRVPGTWLIWVAAVLTVWSMFYYLRRAWPVLRDGGRHGGHDRDPG